jgi:phosphoglycerate dehydrogenase-like enzyme
MRERTPLPGSLIDRLPRLQMLGITGERNASLDMAVCTARGIPVCNTVGGTGRQAATAELALGLLLAAARAIPAAGAILVSKAALFSRSDAVSIHLVLSPRSRGLIGASDIAMMKPGAILINTPRDPIVDEAALIEAVRSRRIVAALDVHDREPLPALHPVRSAPNPVLTPNLGYGVRETWTEFYRQSIENALAFLDGKPVRVMNPESLRTT